MKKRTVNKVHANAAAARGTINAFNDLLSPEEQMLFRKYFHIRPDKKTLTVLSMLEYAPMYTCRVKVTKLRQLLDALRQQLPVLTGTDTGAASAALKKLGFKKDKKKRYYTNCLKAAFIRGMIAGQRVYGDVKFIGTRLPLAKKKKSPFCVIGSKDRTLYLFTLSDRLDENAIREVEICRTQVLDASHDCRDRQRYDRVLRDYPWVDFDGFDNVACVAVLNGGAVAPEVRRAWAEQHNTGKVQLWFYEMALGFMEII